jgi:hypothetical protein
MEKQAWQKPELIVLVRSYPEEAVLANCKATAMGSSSPNTGFNSCNYSKLTGAMTCTRISGTCQTIVTS